MAVNKEFSKFKWVFPERNPRVFKGAIQEYKLKNGKSIAVAFVSNGAFIIEDEQGYFGTIDYIAKDGIFNSGTPIDEYAEAKALARVFIAASGDKIEGIDIDENNFKSVAFEDADDVKRDIENRLKAVGRYGFFTVFTG